MAFNDAQKMAIRHREGPMLVLAGPGSGKTTVITNRVRYLTEKAGVDPSHILVITFTRAAAREMKERYEQITQAGCSRVSFGTFHSVFFLILKLAYRYKAADIVREEQRVQFIKEMLSKCDLEVEDEGEFISSVLSEISMVKGDIMDMDHYYAKNCSEDMFRQLYRGYEARLRQNRLLDFDDMLVMCYELFKERKDILSAWQDKYRYILIDEFQDINRIQYEIVKMLALPRNNLFIVGDDDQSIYRFRGADIGNILSFEETFPGAKVIKLEQNYRSTQNILNAANGVIRHNRGRKDKTLWTANGEGDLIRFKQFDTAREEADFVAREIRDSGYAYQDQAVLYRTNAQSRLLEERCIFYNVPYRLVGGVNFYQRKEIKDILAYLKTIANGVDDLSVLRIINVPKRGIGATTMGKVTIFASEHGMSLYDALREARQIPGIGKVAEKIGTFIGQMESFRARAQSEDYTIQDLIEGIMDETGYQQELEAEGEVESQTRLENIEELVNKAVSYEEDSEHPTLDEFLEQVALVADIDNMDESENRVTLMTLHSAKGLEFPKVYLVGLEDGLFPSMMSINSDDKTDMEEERRLCYVGMTRAKNELVITSARQRMVNGETRYCKPSRFLEEVPGELLEEERLEPVLGSFGSRNNGDGAGGFGRSGISGEAGLPWNQPAPGNTRTSTFGKGYNAYASGASQPLSGRGAGSPAGNPGFGKAFTVQKAASLDYGEGDRVRHIKFGEGTVKSIRDGGKDYEVTVVFDGAGQKKMFASFAKLKKV